MSSICASTRDEDIHELIQTKRQRFRYTIIHTHSSICSSKHDRTTLYIYIYIYIYIPEVEIPLRCRVYLVANH